MGASAAVIRPVCCWNQCLQSIYYQRCILQGYDLLKEPLIVGYRLPFAAP